MRLARTLLAILFLKAARAALAVAEAVEPFSRMAPDERLKARGLLPRR